MRVLCLSKRRYMRQDLIDDRYGRMWHLPAGLADAGLAVSLEVTAYTAATRPLAGCLPSGLELGVHAVSPKRPGTLIRWPGQLLAAARQARPDLIYAFSDAMHLILGAWLARRLGVPLVGDFYDNYEAYGASRLPFLTWAMRRAARQARLLTCVSEAIRDLLVEGYAVPCPVKVLPNAVDAEFLHGMPQAAARAQLGLPPSGRLIGTAGNLSPAQSTAALIPAFEAVARVEPDLHLVLAGAGLPTGRLPDRVIHLGALPHSAMPAFWRSLDLGVVLVRDDVFGHHCHPQKAVEMAACNLPMVVPDTRVFAAGDYGPRYRVDDAGALAAAIRQQLERRERPQFQPSTWADLARGLAPELMALAS